MEYRHTSSPRPKKFKTMRSAGKILLTVFWDSQRVYMTEFLEAGKTVNSARYIETIKNLQQRVCRVRGSTSRILLLHDNARPHTARATIDALETLKFEVLSNPPYSPDLAPSDFHFFPHLKRDLKGTHFTSDDEVKQAVMLWIKQWTPEFFIDDMRKLVLRWGKMYWTTRRLSKKKCQFVAKILYFTSYFHLFKYMVSFPRYFTVCITYQPPLIHQPLTHCHTGRFPLLSKRDGIYTNKPCNLLPFSVISILIALVIYPVCFAAELNEGEWIMVLNTMYWLPRALNACGASWAP